jgi:hypothetical protein
LETKLNLVFDIETDGFVSQCTQIHCLGIHDLDTDTTYVFNDKGDQEPISRGVQMLMDADSIIGHNIINFDCAVLRKLYSWFNQPKLILDTLLLSRLYHPDILNLDHRKKWKNMPLQLYGRHSLESYGYRLGEYKGEFGKTSDWKEWSQDLQDYMVQDVNVTVKLWEHFVPYLNGSR